MKLSDAVRIMWQATTMAVIVATLIVVLVSVVANVRGASLVRICGVASASQVDGNVGEAAARYVPGQLNIDFNSDLIQFWVDTLDTMSAVTALEIRGPKRAGLSTGPLAAVLCGQASITTTITSIPSCNTFATPGTTTGFIETVYNSTTATAIRPLMHAIRANRRAYYLEIMTADYPVTPGAARMSLVADCGQP